MSEVQQYRIRCAHCGVKVQAGEEILGERLTCPACLETFLVPAFPDPAAGVEQLAPPPPPPDSKPEHVSGDIADEQAASETTAAEEQESGVSWPILVGGLVACVGIVVIVVVLFGGDDAPQVTAEDIMIVDRDVRRISDSEIKWFATIINRAQVATEMTLELQIQDVRGEVIYRDEIPPFNIQPSHRRKLQWTSQYDSSDNRSINRYQVVPKLQ